MKNRHLLIPILLTIFLNYQTVFPKTPPVSFNLKAETFWRTELYFGRDKNDGTQVSDDEWGSFLDEIVTPKFPQGFTVIDTKGQWRNDAGIVVKENSKVLILLYPSRFRKSASRRIQQIRQAYFKKFNQQSVMRVDTRQNYIYF